MDRPSLCALVSHHSSFTNYRLDSSKSTRNVRTVALAVNKEFANLSIGIGVTFFLKDQNFEKNLFCDEKIPNHMHNSYNEIYLKILRSNTVCYLLISGNFEIVIFL